MLVLLKFHHQLVKYQSRRKIFSHNKNFIFLLNLPTTRFVTDRGDVYGLQRDVNTLFDDTSFQLSLQELENRFNEMPIEMLHPLLEEG